MRLSDIMGHMDLAFWPQAALVIFLGVFAAVAWREWRSPRRDDTAARLPLEED